MTRFDALIGVVSYSIGVAAFQATEINDEQALLWAISAGIMGGLFASVSSKTRLGPLEYISRIIASGVCVPLIVYATYIRQTEILTLYPVVAYSGASGLAAWPLVSLIKSGLEKISAADVKEWIVGVVKRMIGQ
jgi:hypothetical protein